MNFDHLSFSLPPELIAQKPVEPRDSCRLLLVNKSSNGLRDLIFRDLVDLVGPNDILVFNNSKVIKARLRGTKPSGGIVEVFLHRHIQGRLWEVMLRGRGFREGQAISLDQGLIATIQRQTEDTWIVELNKDGEALEAVVNEIGQVPLPPYIKESTALIDYQTIYAQEPGSVAAPTAGLHFTPELLAALQAKGVGLEYVTLHVGLGTFKPIKTERLEDHVMHSEAAYLSGAVAERLNEAKRQGKRIIAVGTTTTRVLETFADSNGRLVAGARDTNIFIYPPYAFRFVNSLITNFHLPDSTLVLLVAALAGQELTRAAYAHAIVEKYRFYSFGDAMFIK